MNRVEESRLTMYLTVKGYCQIEAIVAILSRLKGFTAMLQSFLGIITKIQTIRTAQGILFSVVYPELRNRRKNY